MPGNYPLQLPLVLSLLAGTQVEPGITLPTGDSPAFRAVPSAPEVKTPPVQPIAAAKALKLPRVSSGFGWRSDPLLGGRRLHAGIDIPGTIGSPVRATAPGTVSFAGRRGGYGNLVEIDHGGGLRSRYGHLLAILVTPGMPVTQGETIARMGSTGRSTGSHLHFELRAHGIAVDPRIYLASTQQQSPPEAPLVEEAATHLSGFARKQAAFRLAKETGF
jgi:murein DD-endopeptidase MepM/ murein hydrolase activator NlpD